MPVAALPLMPSMSVNADRVPARDPLGDAFVAGVQGDAGRYAAALRDCAQRLRPFLGGRLLRFAPSLVGDTEDIVQECLLALHLKAHTYDPAQPFLPWMYAIARYKLIDTLRRRQPGREVSLEVLADDGLEWASDESEEPTTRRDLAGLLAQLPDKQRRPIELVKLQGRSVAEAAASTGLSISAVKVGIHRGLKALSKRMGTEGHHENG